MKGTVKEILKDSKWHVTGEKNMDVLSVPGLSVEAHTYIAEREDLQRKIDIDRVPGFVFVSKLSFNRNLGRTQLDLIRGVVNKSTKRKFADVLTENGVQKVEMVGSERTERKNVTVKSYEYTGFITVESSEFSTISKCHVFHNDENYYIIGYSKVEREPSKIFSSASENIKPEIIVEKSLDGIL